MNCNDRQRQQLFSSAQQLVSNLVPVLLLQRLPGRQYKYSEKSQKKHTLKARSGLLESLGTMIRFAGFGERESSDTEWFLSKLGSHPWSKVLAECRRDES